MVAHLPGFNGNPGCVRSRAWIWLFSSMDRCRVGLGFDRVRRQAGAGRQYHQCKLTSQCNSYLLT
jgi:hypothetical protein